jgi:hypothetical protein
VHAKVGFAATVAEDDAYIPTTRAAFSAEIMAYEYTPRSKAPTKQKTSHGNSSAVSMTACPPWLARLRDAPAKAGFRNVCGNSRIGNTPKVTEWSGLVTAEKG